MSRLLDADRADRGLASFSVRRREGAQSQRPRCRRSIQMLTIRRLAPPAATLLGLVPASAGASSSGLLLGVQDAALLTSGESGAWPAVTTLHPGVVRYNVTWDAIAPTRPADAAEPDDPADDWSTVDELARRVAEIGAQPLFTIVQSPGWANGGGPPAPPPPAPGPPALPRAP